MAYTGNRPPISIVRTDINQRRLTKNSPSTAFDKSSKENARNHSQVPQDVQRNSLLLSQHNSTNIAQPSATEQELWGQSTPKLAGKKARQPGHANARHHSYLESHVRSRSKVTYIVPKDGGQRQGSRSGSADGNTLLENGSRSHMTVDPAGTSDSLDKAPKSGRSPRNPKTHSIPAGIVTQAERTWSSRYPPKTLSEAQDLLNYGRQHFFDLNDTHRKEIGILNNTLTASDTSQNGNGSQIHRHKPAQHGSTQLPASATPDQPREWDDADLLDTTFPTLPSQTVPGPIDDPLTSPFLPSRGPSNRGLTSNLNGQPRSTYKRKFTAHPISHTEDYELTPDGWKKAKKARKDKVQPLAHSAQALPPRSRSNPTLSSGLMWFIPGGAGETYTCPVASTSAADRIYMPASSGQAGNVVCFQHAALLAAGVALEDLEVAVYDRRIGYRDPTVGINAEGAMSALSPKPKTTSQQPASTVEEHAEQVKQTENDERCLTNPGSLSAGPSNHRAIVDGDFQQPATVAPQSAKPDHGSVLDIITVGTPSGSPNPHALNETVQLHLDQGPLASTQKGVEPSDTPRASQEQASDITTTTPDDSTKASTGSINETSPADLGKEVQASGLMSNNSLSEDLEGLPTSAVDGLFGSPGPLTDGGVLGESVVEGS